ncbi:hypothetical protein [Bryobacter aggregatus]|uniref:hypothetical protein n=1 Tax=Bryobacter aggregatus TaxID=360054 RepID=UPI0004E1BE97|nr:hypothetical protein [Bryobacter aggregatus]
MKYKLLVVAASSVLAWLSGPFFGSYVVQAQEAQHSPKLVSLVANQTTTSYSPTGEVRDSFRSTIARRSDGSQVEIRHFQGPEGKPAENRLLLDVPGLKRISVSGPAESITTYKMDQAAIAQKIAATVDPRCGLEEGAERITVLGVEALHAYKTIGHQKREIWRAPSLGCFELKAIATQTLTDGREARTVVDTLSLEQREPDPAMFQVPAWPEMSPSEVYRSIQRRYPNIPAPPASTDAPADAAYRSRKQN